MLYNWGDFFLKKFPQNFRSRQPGRPPDRSLGWSADCQFMIGYGILDIQAVHALYDRMVC
ncbi:hypothetical protein [Lactobacillus phage JCL1032]|uniref:hypothetical protein n=1 Tax=Lactobacillus phage JCL1032 TaxID=37105 RepID=UPI000217AA19|nr:hypothetical protein F367_gp71 [Lactobacillus phage JCL1032]ACB72611.1 hypothetical protein [Lactobacillus phage JCL1032]